MDDAGKTMDFVLLWRVAQSERQLCFTFMKQKSPAEAGLVIEVS